MPQEMRHAWKVPRWREARRRTVLRSKRAHALAVILAIGCLGLPGTGAFAGLTQPAMILAGTVHDADGHLLLEGTMTIAYTPEDGGASVVVQAPLAERVGPAGILSYAAMVPLEIETADSPVSAGALPVTSDPVQYTRTMQVVGAGISRTDSVTISTDSAGSIERVNLRADETPQGYHSGDVNRDNRFSLQELLREIDLFVADAGHQYHCDRWGEDGFDMGPGAQDCAPHGGDYAEPRWQFSLEELLRMIELFAGTGYHEYCADAQGIDGFRVGACAEKRALMKTELTRTDFAALAMSRTAVGGGVAAIDVTITFSAVGNIPVMAVGLEEWLPDGWVFDRVIGGDAPGVAPMPGTSGQLDFAWFPVPVEGGTFTYRVVPDLDRLSFAEYDPHGSALYRVQGIREALRIGVVQNIGGPDSDYGGRPAHEGSDYVPGSARLDHRERHSQRLAQDDPAADGRTTAARAARRAQEEREGSERVRFAAAPVQAADSGIPDSPAADLDKDGMSNALEGAEDFDGDGISNYLDTDSDGDGVADGVEWAHGTDYADPYDAPEMSVTGWPLAMLLPVVAVAVFRIRRRRGYESQ